MDTDIPLEYMLDKFDTTYDAKLDSDTAVEAHKLRYGALTDQGPEKPFAASDETSGSSSTRARGSRLLISRDEGITPLGDSEVWNSNPMNNHWESAPVREFNPNLDKVARIGAKYIPVHQLRGSDSTLVDTTESSISAIERAKIVKKITDRSTPRRVANIDYVSREYDTQSRRNPTANIIKPDKVRCNEVWENITSFGTVYVNNRSGRAGSLIGLKPGERSILMKQTDGVHGQFSGSDYGSSATARVDYSKPKGLGDIHTVVDTGPNMYDRAARGTILKPQQAKRVDGKIKWDSDIKETTIEGVNYVINRQRGAIGPSYKGMTHDDISETSIETEFNDVRRTGPLKPIRGIGRPRYNEMDFTDSMFDELPRTTTIKPKPVGRPAITATEQHEDWTSELSFGGQGSRIFKPHKINTSLSKFVDTDAKGNEFNQNLADREQTASAGARPIRLRPNSGVSDSRRQELVNGEIDGGKQVRGNYHTIRGPIGGLAKRMDSHGLRGSDIDKEMDMTTLAAPRARGGVSSRNWTAYKEIAGY